MQSVITAKQGFLSSLLKFFQVNILYQLEYEIMNFASNLSMRFVIYAESEPDKLKSLRLIVMD